MAGLGACWVRSAASTALSFANYMAMGRGRGGGRRLASGPRGWRELECSIASAGGGSPRASSIPRRERADGRARRRRPKIAETWRDHRACDARHAQPLLAIWLRILLRTPATAASLRTLGSAAAPTPHLHRRLRRAAAAAALADPIVSARSASHAVGLLVHVLFATVLDCASAAELEHLAMMRSWIRRSRDGERRLPPSASLELLENDGRRPALFAVSRRTTTGRHCGPAVRTRSGAALHADPHSSCGRGVTTARPVIGVMRRRSSRSTPSASTSIRGNLRQWLRLKAIVVPGLPAPAGVGRPNAACRSPTRRRDEHASASRCGRSIRRYTPIAAVWPAAPALTGDVRTRCSPSRRRRVRPASRARMSRTCCCRSVTRSASGAAACSGRGAPHQQTRYGVPAHAGGAIALCSSRGRRAGNCRILARHSSRSSHHGRRRVLAFTARKIAVVPACSSLVRHGRGAGRGAARLASTPAAAWRPIRARSVLVGRIGLSLVLLAAPASCSGPRRADAYRPGFNPPQLSLQFRSWQSLRETRRPGV